MVDRIIDNQETIKLSGTEVENIVGRKARVIPYHELPKYSSIEEVLGLNKEVVILYESKYNVGHFVSLFIQPNNPRNLIFFDPYGFYPDYELNFAKYNHIPYLTNLIKNSNLNLLYNKYRLQEFSSDTNTCGRWSALRLRFKHYNNLQFSHLFTTNKCYTPDFWVSALTLLYTI